MSDLPGEALRGLELDDPAGKTLEEVRPIRDELERRTRLLLAGLLADQLGGQHLVKDPTETSGTRRNS
jgi:hypothetical protein